MTFYTVQNTNKWCPQPLKTMKNDFLHRMDTKKSSKSDFLHRVGIKKYGVISIFELLGVILEVILLF